MAKDKNHVYNICMWTDQLPKGVIPEPSATQRIGSKNGMYGKRHSEESKQKMRNSIEKISQCYAEYKSNGGELPWKAFRHALSIGDISMEALNEQ